MLLVLSVGVNFAVPICGRRIAVEAAPALAVLYDHDFALEAVRVFKNALDEALYQIAVCAASVFPLGIDLEENDIVCRDQAVGSVLSSPRCCPVELEAVLAHEVEESVNSDMMISCRNGLVGDLRHAEERALR